MDDFSRFILGWVYVASESETNESLKTADTL
jgi:hypothetical protein